MNANGNPSGELPLSGGWNIAAAEGFGFAGDMVTENLTPGGKLADYSDGELFRVLRYGPNQDGDLLAFMPLLPEGITSEYGQYVAKFYALRTTLNKIFMKPCSRSIL